MPWQQHVGTGAGSSPNNPPKDPEAGGCPKAQRGSRRAAPSAAITQPMPAADAWLTAGISTLCQHFGELPLHRHNSHTASHGFISKSSTTKQRPRQSWDRGAWGRSTKCPARALPCTCSPVPGFHQCHCTKSTPKSFKEGKASQAQGGQTRNHLHPP